MTEEPASRQMRAEIGDVRSDIGQLRADISEIRTNFATKSDMHSLRADVAADMFTNRKELSEQIVGLRRAAIEYHTSVIGHGRRTPLGEAARISG